MSEVKRFEWEWTGYEDGEMQANAIGDYVLHSDYARLEQECERLRAESENIRARWTEYGRELEAERDAALKQVEGLRELLADWNAHFTGPKVFGGPLSSLRERTETTLSAKP